MLCVPVQLGVSLGVPDSLEVCDWLGESDWLPDVLCVIVLEGLDVCVRD